MNAGPMTLNYVRLRAPQQNGQALQVPPLCEFDDVWLENHARLDAHQVAIDGISIQVLRQQAQDELIQLARQYTSTYRDVGNNSGDRGVILSGHQPTLFHPGVWYKNFALASLADRASATGVNLIIDNDLCTTSAISVPTVATNQPGLNWIHYDQGGSYLPFEMTTVRDASLWKTFGDRAAAAVAPWVANPLVTQLWPLVRQIADQDSYSPYALAAGRHRLEAEFGLQHLEIPLSRLCKTVSFAHFAAELIRRGGELRGLYNHSLLEYRRLHRIRSQAHPVPELDLVDNWVEVPFWIWRTNAPQRRRLFVKQVAGEVRISDADQWETHLDEQQLAEQLFNLQDEQVFLRPRALITTMYARMVLGQCFLHGIGGAKYDQLTDVIAARMFGVDLPTFFVLTATCQLPTQVANVQATDISSLDHRIRQLRFHPERFADSQIFQENDLVQRKQELIARIPPRGDKLDWHREITEINLQLQPLVQKQQALLESERDRMQAELARNRILGSREFSFCLFPETLAEDLTTLCRPPH